MTLLYFSVIKLLGREKRKNRRELYNKCVSNSEFKIITCVI